MKSAGVTYNKILDQINKDWAGYVGSLARNLATGTPVDTGKARRTWRQLDLFKIDNHTRKKKILDNRVGYASILDGSEGRPTSRQAPRGIVEPALRKTRQK
tara:strand:+ start:256 stop:558 length:303 start_codon:yes stop_codon:yes gene_type:complete